MAHPNDPTHYSTELTSSIELVKIAEGERGSGFSLPPSLRDRITIDTVHDGAVIPAPLLELPEVQRLRRSGELWRYYVLERDWGANMVAYHLARLLGLEGYHRVNVARVVMDFNRFPGSSPPLADHFNRLAISPPMSDVLSFEHKRDVLERYYDRISTTMERAISGKLIKLAIHTYDVHNPSRTERPEVSLITRSHSYQNNSHLPFGLFDPLFPDVLMESSTDPVLRDRVALTLQKLGLRLEHNYPYCLPDGSLEVRSQPWMFFSYLRRAFEEQQPDTAQRPHYERVWNMLFNTNLRRADSEVLYGYLHRFRRPSHGAGAEMAAARRAYDAIAGFLEQRPEVLERYRQVPGRMSALAIEVRKDLLWRFEDGEPVEPLESQARDIAQKIAEGIRIYFESDRPELRDS